MYPFESSAVYPILDIPQVFLLYLYLVGNHRHLSFLHRFYTNLSIYTHGISDRNKTGQESLSKPKINATFYFYRSARNPLFFIAFNNYIKYGIQFVQTSDGDSFRGSFGEFG